MRRAVILPLAVLVAVLHGGASARPAAAPEAGVASLRLVNYYPADNAWTYMWTRWRPAAIARDFERIRALGANSVRVIVAPQTFGYPEPQAPYTGRLGEVVRLAAARGLRVQLTLFDWWSDYADVEGSRRWAAAVLGPYAGDERIALVELQNELRPEDGAALAWARVLLPHVRTVSGRPVALSPLGPPGTAVARLVAGLGHVRPDVVSAHHFGPSELAHVELQAAVAAAAPTPVLLGETGYSTDVANRVVPGLARTRSAREAAQDLYLRRVALATRALGLPPPAPWVLSDFRPSAIPSGGPTGPIERRFGLLRLDGSAKPAAASVRAAFRAAAISRAFNNGFERAGGATARAGAAGWQVRGGANARVRRDTGVARRGRASVRIESVRGRPTGRPALYVAPLEIVRPGAAYAAAAWARGRGSTGTTRVVLVWFDRDGREAGRARSGALRGGRAPWQRLRVTATAPDGAAFVRLYLESERSRGTVWFDDVVFGRAG